MAIRRDLNELRYNSILLLPKQGNSEYWATLFRNAKNFFIGMNREDLVEQLNYIIYEKIERIMSADINHILFTYKNLPFLNSFTRSKNPVYAEMNIYKYTIKTWLEQIETWVFQKVIELEGEIRFTIPAKQFI